jgi:hypothetical protein
MNIKNLLIGLLFTLVFLVPLASASPVTVDLHFFTANGDYSSSSSMNIDTNTEFSFGVLTDNQFYDTHVDYPLDVVMLNSRGQRVNSFVQFNDLGPNYNRIFTYQISQPGTYYIVADTDGALDNSCQDNEGSCDVLTLNVEAEFVPVYGCTDPTAFNYNSNANTNDGSCVAIVDGCTDETAMNYDSDANRDNGFCNHNPRLIVGRPPVYEESNDVFYYTGSIGREFYVRLRGLDQEQTDLTFAWNSDVNGEGSWPSGFSIENRENSMNGYFRWTPTESGTFAANLIVNDGYGGRDSQVVVFTIGNNAPTLDVTPQPDEENYNSWTYNIYTEQEIDLTILGEDRDGDELDFSFEFVSEYLNPGFVDYNYGNDQVNIKWTPSEEGTYALRVKLTDGKDWVYKTIIMNVRNPVPEIGVLPNYEVYENGVPLSFQVSGSDANNELVYVAREACDNFICRLWQRVLPADANDLPDYVEFDSQTGEFYFAPDYEFVQHPDREEQVRFQFRTYDGSSSSNWEYTTITVVDVNRVVLARIFAPNTAFVGEEVLFVAQTTDDPDGDSLTYDWDFADRGSDNGRDVTHTFNSAGEYEVSLTVDDGFSGVVESTKLITIEDAVVYGCTDSDAFNYDANANTDDGSCEAVVEGCTDSTAFNYDINANTDDGSCEAVVEGCTNSNAFNYDPNANTDDGSCVKVVEGCTDSDAFNYDVNANTDDGSCEAVVEGCTDSDAFNYDVNANTDDGSCEAVVEGCTDVRATNYDASANVNDGSCEFACVDTDRDGVCDVDEVEGCTNPTAFNYNPLATDNDGSCVKIVMGCTDSDAFNFNPLANTEDGSCEAVVEGCTDVRATNYDASANVNDGSCEFACIDTDRDGVCDVDEVEGCTNPTAFNYNPLATDNDGSCVKIVMGCTNVRATNYNSNANVDDGSCDYACIDTDRDGVCDVDEVEGCTNPLAFNYNPLATQDDRSCVKVVEGCTNPKSFNYDANANTDDGSCEAVVEGCTNVRATNYNANANVDDGSCEYYRNDVPELTVAGKTTVYEGDELTLGINVEDDSVGISNVRAYQEKCFLFICVNRALPKGAELTPVTNAGGIFTWTPDYTFVEHPDRSEEITFVFSIFDGEYISEQEVNVIVIDVNQLPELTVETNKPFSENKEARVVVVATDGDSEDDLELSATNVPKWASVKIGGDQLTIRGTPGCDAAGTYNIIVSVTDGVDTVTEEVVLDVAETCDVSVFGCTDSDALNYNSGANTDDGSCVYAPVDVLGCTDSEALNYNSVANIDDGSCVYALVDVLGCTDSDALNYNSVANIDDGSCEYAPLHDDANIASVRLNSEVLSPGDYLYMYVRMSNDGDTDFDDMRVKAIVYDWGQKAVSGEFDLRSGQEKGREVVMQVPYHVQPGDYLIKVTMENDYYHESMYRLVTIY